MGGTGQFIRSIIEGWKIPAAKPNPRMRQALTQWVNVIGSSEIHRKLTLLDPQAARTIDPTNVRRTIRALEIIFSTGKRLLFHQIPGENIFVFINILHPDAFNVLNVNFCVGIFLYILGVYEKPKKCILAPK